MRCDILEPDYKEAGQQVATEQLLARSVIFQISRKIYDRPIEELYYDYTKGKKSYTDDMVKAYQTLKNISTGGQGKPIHQHTDSRFIIISQIEVTSIETITTCRKMQPGTNV